MTDRLKALEARLTAAERARYRQACECAEANKRIALRTRARRGTTARLTEAERLAELERILTAPPPGM